MTVKSEQFELEIIDSLHVVLEQSVNPGEEWLWCLFCEHFFQARYLRMDFLGSRQGCAFCECAGFDCALFMWDTFRKDGDTGWPESTAELRHGLCSGEEGLN
jgi:hypothetical protein